MPDKLTPKRQRFVDEYLIDLNATQAAIRAGYAPATANVEGARLLANASVARAVEAAKAARAKRTGVTQDRVVAELARMAFYDPAALAVDVKGPQDIPSLPEEVRRAIVGWSWDRNGNFTLKLSPKTPSLELLGRHLGLFDADAQKQGVTVNLHFGSDDEAL